MITFCLLSLLSLAEPPQQWISHVPSADGKFTSEIILSHSGDTRLDLSLKGYRANGQVIATLSLSLAPHETQRHHPQTLFQDDGLSHIQLSADQPYACWIAYRAKSGEGPRSIVPAMSTASPAWVLHSGVPEVSWDGVAIINLGAQPTAVVLRVLNDTNDVVQSFTVNASLGQMEKTLVVPDDVSPGSLIQIVADQPLIVLGLSGDHEDRLLWSNAVSPSQPRVGSMDYQLTPVFNSATFDSPIDLQFAPDAPEIAYVVQQDGQIQQIAYSPNASPSSFLDIRNAVTHNGEMGLLGLAFHPNFQQNRELYVNYTTSKNGPRRSVIARFWASGDSVESSSQEILLEVDQPFSNHNGGQLLFGPDGYLYIALGDGGSGGDPFGNGQDRKTLLGSILRIDVNQSDPPLPYAIPEDNPFTPLDDGSRFEIYAYGLRNPWRMSFDTEKPHPLWVADVGQDRFEEIHVVAKGDNCGWNLVEGTSCFEPPQGCSQDGLAAPVYTYNHENGDQSVTGGFVYRGDAIPSLQGRYVFGDFVSGRIWALELGGGPAQRTELLQTQPFSLASFAQDPNGEVLVCSFTGRIYRLDWTITP